MTTIALIIIAAIGLSVVYLAIEKESDRPELEAVLAEQGRTIARIERVRFGYWLMVFSGKWTISGNARIFLIEARDPSGKMSSCYGIIDPIAAPRVSIIPLK
jgi:hypothetical protein